MADKYFLGKNGFVWFTGVVEDRHDPEYLGRVRVRAIGFHTDNKEKLPTADLPWASVSLPVTSAGISGLGYSPAALVEGSWVWGYFRDGELCQKPVILGSLPGYPIELADTSKGFYDPNGVYPKYKDERDTNRLAVNLKDDNGNEINPHLSLTLRRATRITGVPTAEFNPFTNAAGEEIDGVIDETFDQPEIPYNTQYPYNKVIETESGHLREYDDTAGAERIHERHKTGTSYEIGPDGTRTDIVKKDKYTLIAGDNKALIEGNSDLTINGRHRLYINKNQEDGNDYTIHIGAGANVNIQVDNGDINLITYGLGNVNMNTNNYNLLVRGDMTVQVEGNTVETIEGSKTSNTTGPVIHRGQTIDLNP